MSKINARDAWVVFTPPTVANRENAMIGRIVVETEARAKLYLGLEPGRRMQYARKLLPEGVDMPEVEVYRAMMRLVTLDGFPFNAVWSAFQSIEGLAEAIPDGAWRDPQLVAVG